MAELLDGDCTRRLQPRLALGSSAEKRACTGERHSTGWDLFQRWVTPASSLSAPVTSRWPCLPKPAPWVLKPIVTPDCSPPLSEPFPHPHVPRDDWMFRLGEALRFACCSRFLVGSAARHSEGRDRPLHLSAELSSCAVLLRSLCGQAPGLLSISWLQGGSPGELPCAPSRVSGVRGTASSAARLPAVPAARTLHSSAGFWWATCQESSLLQLPPPPGEEPQPRQPRAHEGNKPNPSGAERQGTVPVLSAPAGLEPCAEPCPWPRPRAAHGAAPERRPVLPRCPGPAPATAAAAPAAGEEEARAALRHALHLALHVPVLVRRLLHCRARPAAPGLGIPRCSCSACSGHSSE